MIKETRYYRVNSGGHLQKASITRVYQGGPPVVEVNHFDVGLHTELTEEAWLQEEAQNRLDAETALLNGIVEDENKALERQTKLTQLKTELTGLGIDPSLLDVLD